VAVGGAKNKTAPTLKEQIAALEQQQKEKEEEEEADRLATAERDRKAFAAKKEAEKKLEAKAAKDKLTRRTRQTRGSARKPIGFSRPALSPRSALRASLSACRRLRLSSSRLRPRTSLTS